MTTDTPFWSDGRIWMDTAHRGARAEASGSRILPIFASCVGRSCGAAPNPGERQLRRWVARRWRCVRVASYEVCIRYNRRSRSHRPDRETHGNPLTLLFSCPPGSCRHIGGLQTKTWLCVVSYSFVAETPVVAGQPAACHVSATTTSSIHASRAAAWPASSGGRRPRRQPA